MKKLFAILLMTFIGLFIPSTLFAQPHPGPGAHGPKGPHSGPAHPGNGHHTDRDYHHSGHPGPGHVPPPPAKHYSPVRYYTPVVPPPPPARYEYCYTRLLPVPHRVCEWRNYTPVYRPAPLPHHH